MGSVPAMRECRIVTVLKRDNLDRRLVECEITKSSGREKETAGVYGFVEA